MLEEQNSNLNTSCCKKLKISSGFISLCVGGSSAMGFFSKMKLMYVNIPETITSETETIERKRIQT